MIRKLVNIVLLLAVALPAVAQQAVGTWKHIPSFGGTIEKIVDSSEMVYALSQGNLASYDKTNDEFRTYSSSDVLSDSKIADIRYNHQKKYLLVIYENGNLDFVYDNGNVVNMPEFRDAMINDRRVINDVAFGNDRVVLGTTFGILVIDDTGHFIIESPRYDENIQGVCIIGDKLIVSTESCIYLSNLNGKHNSLASFLSLDGWGAFNMCPVDDHRFLAIRGGSNRQVSLYIISDDYTWKRYENTDMTNVTMLQPLASGRCFAYSRDAMGIYDSDASLTRQTIPQQLSGKAISASRSFDEIWSENGDGIGSYAYVDGQLTGSSGVYSAQSISGPSVGYIYESPTGRLYFGSRGFSYLLPFGQKTRTFVDRMDSDGNLVNLTPGQRVGVSSSLSDNAVYDNTHILESLTDADTYIIGNVWEGIYWVKDGEIIKSYDWTNSPFKSFKDSNYYCAITDIKYDTDGNIWAIGCNTDDSLPLIYFLPSEKTINDHAPEAGDWQSVIIRTFEPGMDSGLLLHSRSNTVICNANGQLLAYDHRGTPANFGDDRYSICSRFTDQDGLNFEIYGISAVVEDPADGSVWIGHEMGVMRLTNPAECAISGNFTFSRFKVPRNDGTSLADYLLDNQHVTSIAIDNSGRKWLGCYNSGVYVVSSDGTKIISHFSTGNSDLPSDNILSLYCDPGSNLVYVGTDTGLTVYSGDSSPAMPDYSEVYAYPNPVRPEYTGWITVTGLMENSYVKIADTAGNVFFSGMAEGGMITWDGCNASGNRVKTGVYYVFASASEGAAGSKGAVTKILVVN